jgi:hypothetical protein
MLATWLYLGGSSKNTKKLNFQPLSNIELFLMHMDLELSVLGIFEKACKSCISLMEAKFWRK